jgi:hypothetical protein
MTKYLTKKTYGDKLLDPRWQKRRLEVFKDADYTCIYCGNKEETLHVHHLCYEKGKEPWEANPTALICLCSTCHKIAHLTNLSEFEDEIIDQLRIHAVCASVYNPMLYDLIQSLNKIILKQKSNGK